MTQLGKFLNSPYFNNSNAVLKLFGYLKLYYPEFDDHKVQKEIVFNKIFPEEGYNVKKITDLFSDLTLLIEEYLVHQDIKSQKSKKDFFKANVLRNRDVYLLYKKRFKKALKTEKKDEENRLNQLHEKADLISNFYLHPKTQKYQQNLEYPYQMMKILDEYFVLGKLKFSCELLARQKTIKEKYDVHFLTEVMEFSRIYQANKNPLVYLYRHIILLFSREVSYNVFIEIKSSFESLYNKLPRKDRRIINQYLINYTVNRIKGGKEKYKKEQFGLFKIALDDGTLLVNNILSDITFLNVIILASDLKEFGWIKRFINKFEQNLDEEKRHNAKVIGYAFLFFAEKKFEVVKEWAKQVKSPSYRYKLISRSIMIRAQYELALLNKIDFFIVEKMVKNFLLFTSKSTLIPESQKKAYSNYLILMKKLTLFYLDEIKDKDYKKHLFNELNSYDKIIAKSWLKEKIVQLN